MLVKLIINFDLTRQIQKNQRSKGIKFEYIEIIEMKKQNVKGKNITISEESYD